MEPMYATVGANVPQGDGWTFEPKYDGVRVLGHATARRVELVTRNGNDKAAQFPEIVAALRDLAARTGPIVLDGEIVALDADGEPARFQALQSRMHAKEGIEGHMERAPSALVAFDLLRIDGDWLTKRPWTERRAALERTLGGRLPRALRLTVSEPDGERMLAEARKTGWEGIIAKATGARYVAGARSRDWLKLKIEFRQEFVVGGFTEPRNSREHLGAMLLGYFDDAGDFIYVGHTGGGFTRDGLIDMRRRLDRVARATSPFVSPPRTNEPAHWVRPSVVVEVKFSEWTADGRLRQPIFLGVRDDKAARDVGREGTSMQRSTTRSAGSPAAKRSSPKAAAKGAKVAKGEKGEKGAVPARSVIAQLTAIERAGGDGTLLLDGGVELNVSSLGKPFFPDAGVTKGGLMRYYARVADQILPVLDGRPLALKRYPNGIGGPAFFQHDPGENVPAGVRTALVPTEDGSKERRFIGGDLATLLHTVQLGTIAANAWHSRVGSLNTPDYAVLDFDPGDDAPFSAAVEAARWTHAVLKSVGLQSAAKTSGAHGIHVLVPLPPRATYATAAKLAERVALRVVSEHPERATVERAIKARPAGSVYVDHMQNARGKMLASAFTVRAERDATVSAPIPWSRVTGALRLESFTVQSVARRAAALGELWRTGMEHGNSAEAIAAAIEALGPVKASRAGGTRRAAR
jgi:bifunctional non-homologous end joining protein LigD